MLIEQTRNSEAERCQGYRCFSRISRYIPATLREALRPFVGGLDDDTTLCPLNYRRAIECLVFDRDSIQHLYESQIDRCNVSESLARKLARATLRALLDRYTHREQKELVAAVAVWPELAPRSRR